MVDWIYDDKCASAYFFRSSVQPPKRKMMLQITQKCNLHCAHCFANASGTGTEMSLELIQNKILPQLLKNQVVKITLTGGEPLCNPQIKDIVQLLLDNHIGVSICTNATLIDTAWIAYLSKYENVHFNVSLDGMRLESHGRFRGNLSIEMFDKIISTITTLGHYKLLNGILTTPNTYATIDEYIDLCCFAKKVGAHYVLMNPLSPFGRGVKTQQLAYTNNEMCLLKKQTELLATDNFQIVYIRFPNNEQKPIGKCPIGSVLYVFTNGDVAICPYMVFAANGENRYNAKDFILGNIFGNEELDLSTEIKKFIRHYLMQNTAYKNCGACSKGCYAIKISNDQDLSDCDFDICPLAGSKTK